MNLMTTIKAKVIVPDLAVAIHHTVHLVLPLAVKVAQMEPTLPSIVIMEQVFRIQFIHTKH